MQEDRRAISSVNNIAATNSASYIQTNLQIGNNEETKNIISSTFGVIKNNLNAFWYAIGLEPNVTSIYEQTISNPDLNMEINGKNYCPHPGVGNLHPYNELGNPSDGCFSFYTMG